MSIIGGSTISMADSHNHEAEKMNYNLSDSNRKKRRFFCSIHRSSVVYRPFGCVDQILIRNAFKLIRKMNLQMWLKFWLMAKIATDAMPNTLNQLQLQTNRYLFAIQAPQIISLALSAFLSLLLGVGHKKFLRQKTNEMPFYEMRSLARM